MAIFEGSFTNASTLKVGIVIARFNDLITNKILSGCLDCLKRHGLDTSELSNQVDIVWVPGSFELPIAARTLMKKKSYDVVIALGAVIRGETSHYDVVISEAITTSYLFFFIRVLAAIGNSNEPGTHTIST